MISILFATIGCRGRRIQGSQHGGWSKDVMHDVISDDVIIPDVAEHALAT